MIVELHAETDIGRVRRGNEDNFLVLDLSIKQAWTGLDNTEPPAALRRLELTPEGVVLVVSDGMGGALAGDVASRMAVEIVRELLMNGKVDAAGKTAAEKSLVKGLWDAIRYANLAIHHRSLEDAHCSGMGATFTGVAVTPKELDMVQVGDSRAYVIRDDEIRLVTKDQSLVQQLIDIGQISEQEAETHMFRNVILQALGAQREVVPVVYHVPLRRNDMLLLCSDGLSGKLSAQEMQNIIQSSKSNLAAACMRLVEEANVRGGEDNITVVLARFTGEDLAESRSEAVTVETLSLEEDTTLSRDNYVAESL
ncbi:MAG: serine/threonine-protein phosphatase [Pyrinomonadaceae bacterium]|nr:serine/threonine-protein phosphatase [Pyrinomonadaceae bacterium]